MKKKKDRGKARTSPFGRAAANKAPPGLRPRRESISLAVERQKKKKS